MALVLAGVALLGAVIAAYSLQMMGFPDGHLTELDRADQPLLAVFVTTSAATAVVSAILGVTERYLGLVRVIAIAWAVLGVVLLVLHLVAASTLESGGGG